LNRPEDGSYYVFVNRSRTHLKILYWDGDGLALWYKRLEQGRFGVLGCEGSRIELDRRTLSLLLDGVSAVRQQRRFSFKK
jgi:transposase